jgi:hypothetical protein
MARVPHKLGICGVGHPRGEVAVAHVHCDRVEPQEAAQTWLVHAALEDWARVWCEDLADNVHPEPKILKGSERFRHFGRACLTYDCLRRSALKAKSGSPEATDARASATQYNARGAMVPVNRKRPMAAK